MRVCNDRWEIRRELTSSGSQLVITYLGGFCGSGTIRTSAMIPNDVDQLLVAIKAFREQLKLEEEI